MSDPVLHVLAGPNGAGKSSYATRVLLPATKLEFVNADVIAATRWPDAPEEHSYAAAEIAATRRDELIAVRTSFITETVFSHPSKVELIDVAIASGYRVYLHVVMVPVELSIVRVGIRVEEGGHGVPEQKIRERYRRLWPLVATAARRAHQARFYDTSKASVIREVAVFERGVSLHAPAWPTWTPAALRDLA